MAKEINIKANIDTKDAQSSVDDLSGSVQDLGGVAGSSFGAIGKGFKSLKTGLKSAMLGFKGLKGAIAATGIGLLLIAFASLAAFFTKTQKGAEMLEVAFAAVGIVVDKLVDVVSSFGSAITKIFDGDISGAFDEMSGAVTGFADEVAGAVTETIALTKALQALEHQEVRDITRKAQLKKDIAELRLLAKGENVDTQEKIELLKQAITKQDELLAIELKSAVERARILKGQQALAKNTIEDDRELAVLQANIINLEAAAFTQTKAIQSELSGLIKKQRAEQKGVHDARIKEINDESAAEEKALQDKLIRDQIESDKRVEDGLKRLEQQAKQNEEEEKLRQEARDARLNGAIEVNEVEAYYEGLKEERTKEEIIRDAELADIKINSQLDTATTIIGIGDSLIKLGVINEKHQKTLAIAQIAVDTARGVSAAVAAGAGIPFPGNIPAIASGVAAVLAGIISAKAALAKSGGATAAPTIDLPSPASISADISPSDDALFSQQQLFGTSAEQIGGNGENQVRAYVTERDITDTQNRINTFEERSTLGG